MKMWEYTTIDVNIFGKVALQEKSEATNELLKTLLDTNTAYTGGGKETGYSFDLIDVLNYYGNREWELITTLPISLLRGSEKDATFTRLIFKRPI